MLHQEIKMKTTLLVAVLALLLTGCMQTLEELTSSNSPVSERLVTGKQKAKMKELYGNESAKQSNENEVDSVATGSSKANNNKAAKINLDLGRRYLAQGNSARAGQRFQKAVTLMPNWLEAVLSLADWHRQYGSAQAAVVEYERAQNLLFTSSVSDRIAVANRLGILYCQQADYGQANVSFATATDLATKRTELAAEKKQAVTAQAEGRFDSRFYGDVELGAIWHNSAYCYFKQARYQELLRNVDKAIELRPTYSASVLLKAQAYSRLAMHKEALVALSDYERMPKSPASEQANAAIVDEIMLAASQARTYDRMSDSDAGVKKMPSSFDSDGAAAESNNLSSSGSTTGGSSTFNEQWSSPFDAGQPLDEEPLDLVQPF